MTRKILIINDTHLDDNPSNEYRWKVFDFAKAELDKGGYDLFLHLGDVLDRKDKHKSQLVNRTVNSFLEIRDKYCPISILGGNHDYTVDRNHCFLRFVSKYENITFIDKPTYWKRDQFLFLPHSRVAEIEWEEWLPIINDPNLKFLFIHQSIIGSKVSNFHELNCGLDPNFFKNVSAKIVSGDIHVPQTLRKVNYPGTQHPVSFGDDYQPRMSVIEDGKLRFIDIKTIKRPHIKKEVNSFDDLLVDLKKLKKEDQVKITLLLDRNLIHKWAELKAQTINYCKDNAIELHDIRMEKIVETKASDEIKDYIKSNIKSLSSKDVLLKFAQTEKISGSLLDIGLKLFKGE
jgi:DNA repair exonuclease SbcCD nuclease subunit